MRLRQLFCSCIGSRRVRLLVVALAAAALCSAVYISVLTPGTSREAANSPGASSSAELPSTAPLDQRPLLPSTLDVIIRGGTVVDGSGKPRFRGSVGVLGDTICCVGDLSGFTARRVLEAAQQFIVPGFINPHSHTYERIFTNPDTASALMQGITLELGGVDGRSPLKLNEHFHRVEQQGTGVNYGLFVGHGSIREHILGYARRAPTAAELEQMKVLVKEAVAAGAFGLSSGLEYLPGSYADTAELVALARAARSAGGAGTIYSTHMRSEGPQLEEAVAEALRIAQKSGLTLKLSHFKVVHPDNWHKLDRVLQLINDYRKHGTAVWADTYPYLAPDYTVGLPLVRAASSYPPELVVIRSCGTNRWEGQTLTATARAMKLPPEEAARVISSGSPQATAVALVVCPHCLDRILQEPWSTLCNDASAKPWYADRAAAEELHPRTYGAFPRFLRLYVREKQLLSWEEAVHLLTGRPARFLQLPDRGLIRVGHHADIVVFNPKTVRDTATYSQPQSYPEGIKYVLVNGVLVVEQGQHIEGARPGQLVRNP